MGKHYAKEGKRCCFLCKQIFPLTAENFYRHNKKGAGGFQYACKPCSKESIRQYRNRHRRRFIKDKDFTCERCGLKEKFYSFFDLHHKDPLIDQQRKRGFFWTEEEIKEVELLCPNCHRLDTIENVWKSD